MCVCVCVCACARARAMNLSPLSFQCKPTSPTDLYSNIRNESSNFRQIMK